jgi:hypothetical protein
MARLSRSLASIAAEQTDRRAAVVLGGQAENAALKAEVRAALAAEGWGDDDARLGTVTVELGRLKRAVGTTQTGMLESGRALLRLQELVGDGGYRALHRAGLIPIPETAASKLRVIAAAVDGGRVPIACLPRAVEAAAIAARVPEQRIGRLIEDGVIRPEVTAKELREAVMTRRVPKHEDGLLTMAQRRALERRRARLLAEVARIDELLGSQQAGKPRG